MSYEGPFIECAWCRNTDGPYVKVSAPAFSASGARPDVEVYACEACFTRRQKEWHRYVERINHGH